MTRVCFTEEMRNILASMKGKTIKSFEGMFYQGQNYFEEQVKLNLGTFSVNLYVNENVPAYFTNGKGVQYTEEISSFACSKGLKNEPFNAPQGWNVYQFLVNEKVSEVILITDTAKTDKGEEYVIDSGVVIKTDYNTYILSKGFWTVPIYFNKQEEIETPFTLQNLKEELSDEGISVSVSRQIRFL